MRGYHKGATTSHRSGPHNPASLNAEFEARMESWELFRANVLRQRARDFLSRAVLIMRGLEAGRLRAWDGHGGISTRDLAHDVEAALRLLVAMPAAEELRLANGGKGGTPPPPKHMLPPEPVPDEWLTLASRIKGWATEHNAGNYNHRLSGAR